MATIAGMLRKIQELDFEQVAEAAISKYTTEIEVLQKKQMMQGKNNKGELFSPRHSENPWFKKEGAGYRYAVWKQRRNPETPFDVPNFYINGYYHNSIFVTVSNRRVNIESNATFAPDIDAVFQNTALGLNTDSKVIAYETFIKPEMLRITQPILGGTIK